MVPQFPQARQSVCELCEFDLYLRLPGLGVAREYIENEFGPVDDI